MRYASYTMNLEIITNELILVGKQQAERLSLPSAQESEFKEKINEILIVRENYNSAINELITQDELANLVLAHFQTLICNNSKIKEPSKITEYADLNNKIKEILFK